MEEICPIISDSEGTNYCFGKDCGWWNSLNEQCSIVTIAETLEKISRG